MVNKEKAKLPHGLLVVFEGIDGTGKSTQLRLLADYLRLHGYPVVTTKEPTEGIYGQQIKDLYHDRARISKEEELNLFLLDRRDHVNMVVKPNLAENKIVLCDRYYLSTIAYQGAAGFTIEEISQKNAFAPQPDIALLFQLNPQSSVKRITRSRGDTLNDFERKDSLMAVEKIFNSLYFPFIKRISADQPIETIHKAVVAIVNAHLDTL